MSEQVGGQPTVSWHGRAVVQVQVLVWPAHGRRSHGSLPLIAARCRWLTGNDGPQPRPTPHQQPDLSPHCQGVSRWAEGYPELTLPASSTTFNIRACSAADMWVQDLP